MVSLHHLRLFGSQFDDVSVRGASASGQKGLPFTITGSASFQLQISSDGLFIWHPIQDLRDIKQEFASSIVTPIHQVSSVWKHGSSCCIRWHTPCPSLPHHKSHHTSLLDFDDAREAEECVQVIGTHLRHFNHKKVNMVSFSLFLAVGTGTTICNIYKLLIISSFMHYLFAFSNF
jgi:hypothetical protein